MNGPPHDETEDAEQSFSAPDPGASSSSPPSERQDEPAHEASNEAANEASNEPTEAVGGPTEPMGVVGDSSSDPAARGSSPALGHLPIGDLLRQPAFLAVAIALVISLVFGFAGWIRWSSETAKVDDLTDEVADLEERVAELETELAAGSGLLDDLLGDDADLGDLGSLADLLGGLLDGVDSGDIGNLGDLLGGLLDGIDAGELGDLGDLEDLLGDLTEDGRDSLDGLAEEGGDALGDLRDSIGNLFGGSDGDSLGALGDDASLYGIGGAAAILPCTDFSLEGDGLPDESAEAQYAAAVVAVEAERELTFEEVPEPTYLRFDEVDERIRDEFETSYDSETAELDSALLAALGIVEPGTDLVALQSDFVGDGQVAGFYDPETGELVVGTDQPDEPLGGIDAIALAHELDHALVDQHLGLPDDDVADEDPDAAFAQLALTEGDATLLMNRFATSALSLADLLDGFDLEGLADQQAALDEVPHAISASLLFPYTQGLEFTCSLWVSDGWSAVDAAYDDLPTTSAQVMWPERYLDGEGAVAVVDPSDPGDGWSQARRTTLGASDLLFLFEAPSNDRDAALDDPVDRAAAWAGGEVTNYVDGDRDLVALSLTERPGERDLCASMRAWYEASFGDQTITDVGSGFDARGQGRAAAMRCDEGDVQFGFADDLAAARSVLAI